MIDKKFVTRIEELANELGKSGKPELAVSGILNSLLAAVHTDSEAEFLHHCCDFTRIQLGQLEEIKAKQN